jgi:hypothetical protein
MELTVKKIITIRERFAAGAPIPELANEYGVEFPELRRILSGHLYREIPGPVLPKRDVMERVVRSIRESYANDGISQKRLSVDYGVHPSYIGRIVRGDMYPELPGPVITTEESRASCRRGHDKTAPGALRKDGTCKLCRAVNQQDYVSRQGRARGSLRAYYRTGSNAYASTKSSRQHQSSSWGEQE